MIAIIRIMGRVGVDKRLKETFKRLNLPRKYSCIVLEETKENLGMLRRIRDVVAFGKIDEKTLEELKKKRGKKNQRYFALHPPRGGAVTKKHAPKGILGDNKEQINKLIERML